MVMDFIEYVLSDYQREVLKVLHAIYEATGDCFIQGKDVDDSLARRPDYKLNSAHDALEWLESQDLIKAYQTHDGPLGGYSAVELTAYGKNYFHMEAEYNKRVATENKKRKEELRLQSRVKLIYWLVTTLIGLGNFLFALLKDIKQ